MMLEQSPPHQSVLHPSPFDNSCSNLEVSVNKDQSFRKKFHSLMSQNFQLKQTIQSLSQQLKTSQECIADLKEKLRSALQQISTNDQIISSHLEVQRQLKEHSQQLERTAQGVREELEAEKLAIASLIEHNRNLQTEAQLVGQIKQKYQLEHTKCKAELEAQRASNERLSIENQHLSCQIDKLLQELDEEQHQVHIRRAQMEEYEHFVLQRLNQAKTDPQFHEKCQAEKDKYYCKYLKYKQRHGLLRKERDELLRHLEQVCEEVGSRSMRKYLQ